jgi:hypothetical protein
MMLLMAAGECSSVEIVFFVGVTQDLVGKVAGVLLMES